MEATAGTGREPGRSTTSPAVPVTGSGRIAMTRGTTRVAGRRIHYQVTDNVGSDGPEGVGTAPVWAVNIHGFFAGGGMYARESRNLARTLGWRVVNPHLPAFGGSDPLPRHRVTPEGYAEAITAVMDELEVEQAVLLGHSMGGAFAVAVADAFPDRTLGVVYRDGVATPAWRAGRRSVPGRFVLPLSGRGADLADMGMSVVWGLPELVAGRHATRLARELWPDASRNIRHLGGSLPVARMLLGLDLHDAVARVAHVHRIPVLAMWGVLDRITPSAAAIEFATATGSAVVWVVGGHSWMLVDPKAQAEAIAVDPRGVAFVEAVVARRLASGSLAAPA